MGAGARGADDAVTFSEIKAEILSRMNLTSAEADTRVGRAINRHYQRITASLNLDATRFTTVNATMSLGIRTVTFTGLEKIDRILDTTDSTNPRLIPQVSLHQLRSTAPGSADPTMWAPQNVTAGSMTALFDTVPQSAYSLQADGWCSLATLSGDDEPAFPASYHDIITWAVLSEELRRKEKLDIAETYRADADQLLEDLQFYLADSHTRDIVQKALTAQGLQSASGGSGGGNTGSTSYTQTGDLTFDRPGTGVAPFAVASDNTGLVANLNADLLDSQTGSYYLDLANATGALAALSALPDIATDRLLGRDTASTGDVETLTVSGGVEFSGSGGIRRSALTGDVTASAGSNATTISNDAVTYAKMQNVAAASRVLGRGSSGGSGDVQELSLSGIGMSGTVLFGPTVCQGRMTLTTAVPVTTSDVTAATTVYFTPFQGNLIALYTGSAWALLSFSELSIAVPASTATNYDLFVDYNSGTPQLVATAWTNATTRATALTTQDGILVKSGTTTQRYVGSFRTTGVSGQTEDSYTKRFCWNYYNRVPSPMRRLESTNSWNYTTATFQQANASASNQLEVLIGVAEDAIQVDLMAHASHGAGGVNLNVAIGEDSTSAAATGSLIGTVGIDADVAGAVHDLHAHLRTVPALGYHYYAWLEASTASGTTTWYGDDNTPTTRQSGLIGMGRR